MQEQILSVGIDIGTSTTQLVFSRLTIENRASSYTIPRISIVDKEVIYRSDIYFTPLLSQTIIDADKVKNIILGEYKKAGIRQEDLKTGAVIITGETARKENANTVLAALSDMAGDFVVATAGPDLESILSAKGAGTDKLSEEKRGGVANIDVGGGTSNIAVFKKGQVVGTCCLDIGGRLIKVEDGKITYIYTKIAGLAEENGLLVTVGERADADKLYRICEYMADQLAAAVHACPPPPMHDQFYTNDGRALPEDIDIRSLTFSGGVADCIRPDERTGHQMGAGGSDIFRYGDIGILLGRAIGNNESFKKLDIYQAKETIRATVVGAGSHTTNISGSTISYTSGRLPMKNIPVAFLSEEEEKQTDRLPELIRERLSVFWTENDPGRIAISLSGKYHTTFFAVQELAKAIILGAADIINSHHPLIVVLENDIAKVLGNALKVLLSNKKDIICIDGIYAGSGDYIDIGEPVAEGRVVPVVTKTLVFNR